MISENGGRMPEEGMISYDTRQLVKITRALKRLKKEGAKVEKPLKRFGVYHLGQTIKGFNKGGRERKKWEKLAPMTLRLRKAAGISGQRPLIARGMGKKSIQTTILKIRGVVVSSTFTRLRYMKIHQTGGRSNFPRSTKKAKIPKRQYLIHTKADIKKALDLIIKHEKEAIQKAGLKRRTA